jgi:hypothetical protein
MSNLVLLFVCVCRGITWNRLNPRRVTLIAGFGVTLSFPTRPGCWFRLGAV